MVPSPNSLGYICRVPIQGFQWLTAREWHERLIARYKQDFFGEDALVNPEAQGVKHPGPLPDHEADAGPFLCCNNHDGEGPRWRRPVIADEPGLFRKFAELDVSDLDQLAGFANSYGFLAIHDRHTYDSLYHEHLSVWVESASVMKVAVTVIDALADDNITAVRSLFRWGRSGGPGRLPPGESDEGWILDTHHHLPRTSWGGGGRVVSWVGVGTDVESPRADVLVVARHWLAQEVTQNLDGQVSPQLVVTEDGSGFAETIVPRTLLAALWCQVFEAVTQGVQHRKCPGCSKWFAIGGREGGTLQRRTTRRTKVYCSDSCRVRVCQRRRERARELAGQGMNPAAIVKAMAGEGHETDLDTVRGWVKGVNKQGGGK